MVGEKVGGAKSEEEAGTAVITKTICKKRDEALILTVT